MVSGLKDNTSEITELEWFHNFRGRECSYYVLVLTSHQDYLSQKHYDYVLPSTVWMKSMISSMNDYALTDCLNHQR